MLDFITYKCLKELHNDNVPKSPNISCDKILNNGLELNDLNNSYINRTSHPKKISLKLKIEENDIKTIPIFKNYSSLRIFEVLNDINKFEFRYSDYQVRFFTNNKNETKIRNISFGSNGIYNKIFDLETIEFTTNGRVVKRVYNIIFDSFFSNLFLNNLLSINIDYYDYVKFCELSNLAQFLYRILKVNRNKDICNNFSLKKLVNKLNLQNTINNNIDNITTYFFELKNKNFITDFKKHSNINGINFLVYF
jgi:hypothetical protein